MDCDLGWLVGRTLDSVVRLGTAAWQFAFSADGEVRAECPWRLIRNGSIVLSSEDHGHQFGLPQPVDAEAECRALIEGAVVLALHVRAETRDMIVTFSSGARLEIVPLSSGYESWQVSSPGRLVVAQGGGNLAEWDSRAEPGGAVDGGA